MCQRVRRKVPRALGWARVRNPINEVHVFIDCTVRNPVSVITGYLFTGRT